MSPQRELHERGAGALCRCAYRSFARAINVVATLEEMQRVVTLDDLRERFAHGDPDLDARFRSRVRDLVGFAFTN